MPMMKLKKIKKRENKLKEIDIRNSGKFYFEKSFKKYQKSNNLLIFNILKYLF